MKHIKPQQQPTIKVCSGTDKPAKLYMSSSIKGSWSNTGDKKRG